LGLAIPGILHPEKSPEQVDYDKALLTFQTNTLGPLLLIKHFSSFLPRKSTTLADTEDALPASAVWMNMSARVGSVSDNQSGGWFSYRASKAGVNQITKSFDHHLRMSAGEKAFSIAMHPGTVKTDLSKDFWATVKKDKLFSVDFAASKILEVVRTRTISDRGRCWDWKGEEIKP
jgi:NAD(P)-dependent dehydrogenase (short-subunit alcohol dehydrogenase family)